MKQQTALELAEHINTVDAANITAVARPIKPRSSCWIIEAVFRRNLVQTVSTPEGWQEIRHMWQMLIDDDIAV